MFRTFMMITTALIVATPVRATEMNHHSHEAAHSETQAAQSIYDADMKAMHDKMMNTKPTGDADIDFVEGMIAHHEGAVTMSKTLLANGRDPEIRRMAEGIIKAQEEEIKFMNEWLVAHKKTRDQ